MSAPKPDPLAAMRQAYRRAGLDESDLEPTWFAQLRRWITDAERDGELEPNAMVLTTATPDGRPSARTVLLKGLDERGLVFFTNLESRKGRELAQNPRAFAVFPWIDLQRQVLVEGAVEPVDAHESDAYWVTRPYNSRLGAAASPQSQVVADREEIVNAYDALAQDHPEDETPIERPEHWGGLRIVPDCVEFWQGRDDRLHDRLRFRNTDEGWVVERLAP
jgi:pyridoxamine 5'-phosphate oxidase